MLTFRLIPLLFLLLTSAPLAALMNLPQQLNPGTKPLALQFLSNIEMRKKQVDDLEKNLEQFKKRAQEENENISRSLNQINAEMYSVKQEVKTATTALVEYYNKKITLLSDRKQNLLNIQELLRNGSGLLEKNLKVAREIIDFLSTKKPGLKPVYSWKEFRETQIRISELLVKNEAFKNKKEHAQTQRLAEKERLASLQKQMEAKNKDRDKIVANAKKPLKPAGIDSFYTIEQDADILAEELNSFNKKIDLSRLTMEVLDLEVRFYDDEIELIQYRVDDLKTMLLSIEKRLILDFNDIEIAKNEWKKESQKALLIKEELNDSNEAKIKEKQNLSKDLVLAQEQLASLKSQGKKDFASTQQVKAVIKNLTAQLAVVDQALGIAEAKKALADIMVSSKELHYHEVDLRRMLNSPNDIEHLDALLVNFKNQKELAIGLLKNFKDKRDKSFALLTEGNRSFEGLKAYKAKLKRKQKDFFKDRSNILKQVFIQIEQANVNLRKNINQIEQYLSINSDLISNQEKMINQYDFIISDLDSRRSTISIWKRSSKAISFEEFTKSLLQAEIFFKKLFWDTPEHLGPITLLKNVRDVIINDYLFLLLLALLFIISYFGTRVVFKIIRYKTEQWLANTMPTQARFFYLSVILSCSQFMLDNFSVVFSWLFIYLHILSKFSYGFIGLTHQPASFYIAAFYIVSIPLLVYLSHQLLEMLKELNEKLSYLVFSENFQDRFILLVTTLLYSTVIILPIRRAFLTYFDEQSIFAIVLLAAYSLILVLTAALFFSKEDIMRLLPTRYTFFIWLKRKVDKHYYSVIAFCIGLLIISNPYIGYSNLAWFLAFAVPSTVLFIYALFLAHNYVRTYSVFLFMKEDEDDIRDKFEHAKTYYGFFVIFSFLLLLFATFILVSRIWGFDYTPSDIWRALSEQWVIKIGVDNTLGFVQFMTVGLFIASGFLTSSLVHRFVLSKLFEILRTEPGAQNTASRIFHYAIIGLAIMLGFTAIKLESFIMYVGGLLILGIGFGLKDFVVDFIAGFFVLFERPIEIGNYIQIDNVEGTVHKIAARSTTIITSRNCSVIVPNKDLITKQITNWGHGRFAVGFEVQVRVEHTADPELVKKLLLGVAQSNPLVLRVPNIVVRLENFEDSSLYFMVRAFISARRVKEQYEIAANLRLEILKTFRENGINLAMPHRIIHNANDNTPPPPPVKPLEIKFDR
jgi:small-conductance mechanosensitive channel